MRLQVEVDGVDETLLKNVQSRLTILLQKDNERLNVGAVRRLHRLADEDIRSALAPFGYYHPKIKKSLTKGEEGWQAHYTIEEGPPVLVDNLVIEIIGDGTGNGNLTAAVAAFALRKGDILNQDLYEQGKKKLANLAFEEGFLEAGFREKVIRIDTIKNKADIRLILDTGRQFYFGDTSSEQHVIKNSLLKRYLPYKEGDPYKPARIFELQSILNQTDYFSKVVVRGLQDKSQDQAVPVEIDVAAPEHLNKYSFGFGYATDTGVRGKVEWENRLFNESGHQITSSLQLAEYENTISFRYRIPLDEDPRYYSWTNSTGYQDKNWENTNTQLFTLKTAREFTNPRTKFSTSIEFRDERYDIGETNGDSILLMPSVTGTLIFADNIINTRNGFEASVTLSGGVNGMGSDATFLQSTISSKAILSPLEDWRLIGRGTLGANFVDSIDSLPPSLRFYTGGDTTIRGYSYRSIGTRDDSGTIIGSKYLVIGSLELERTIHAQWSVAAFWDVGTATDDLALDFYQGAGVGIRFRLPFGQIKLDLASAISEDGYPLRLHFTVGGDM